MTASVANTRVEGRPPVSSEFELAGTDGARPSIRAFFWILQQLDHALEQTPGAAAVEAAMIETQCDLRFGLRNEFLFRFVPRRNFFSERRVRESWSDRAGESACPSRDRMFRSSKRTRFRRKSSHSLAADVAQDRQVPGICSLGRRAMFCRRYESPEP